MSDLILHHYDLSPFSEKVRLTMGYKGLSWHSVEVPIWPPRPELTPLTAGYRRVPVLQVGADVYCDTLLILRELDRRHPEPTLYPDEQTGLNAALSQWVDGACFMPAAALTTSIIGDTLPAEFLADRIAFMKHDFSREASLRDLPVSRQRMHAALGVLADLLKDGRPFLLGRNLRPRTCPPTTRSGSPGRTAGQRRRPCSRSASCWTGWSGSPRWVMASAR